MSKSSLEEPGSWKVWECQLSYVILMYTKRLNRITRKPIKCTSARFRNFHIQRKTRHNKFKTEIKSRRQPGS